MTTEERLQAVADELGVDIDLGGHQPPDRNQIITAIMQESSTAMQDANNIRYKIVLSHDDQVALAYQQGMIAGLDKALDIVLGGGALIY